LVKIKGVEFVVPRRQRYDKRDRQVKGKMRSSDYQRVAMLDLRREILFKYDVGEVFEEAGFSEDEARPYIANIVAKGSRISLKEAKDYTRSMQEGDKLTKDTCNKICNLLDKYRKYR
jgi:hypothetical protein